MIEFGKTLRAAREAKGLSVAQLAEQTRMTPTRVEDLENENFTNFPAAIYGRGFVRLYCEAVGLDPKPLTDEFMEIFNGNRELEIRERAPAPEAETVEEKIVDIPPILEREPLPADAAPAPAASPSDADAAPHETSDAPTSPRLSRYAAPLRDRPRIAVPPTVWRLGILACVALLVLWGLVVGIRALYRATGGAPAETDAQPPALDEPAAQQAQPTPTPTATPTAAKPAEGARTPQDVPALYID